MIRPRGGRNAVSLDRARCLADSGADATALFARSRLATKLVRGHQDGAGSVDAAGSGVLTGSIVIKQSSVASFDDLVSCPRAAQLAPQCQGLGSFEFDHKLKVNGLPHGHLVRLFALEHAGSVLTEYAVAIYEVGPVAHQASGHGVQAIQRGERIERLD